MKIHLRSRSKRPGFTLIELLVVIAIIAILASILFPVFSKARAKARQATCTSQIRQIATAVQMYVQDNGGQYPGVDGGSSWVSKLASYLGNSQQMFQCPEDTTKDTGGVSYALSGLLIRPNTTGVKEANVYSPSEVGVVADASPTTTYPDGRLLGGGGQLVEADVAATPEARHSKGCIVGYADGHAKYFQGKINEKDLGNGVTRAVYAAASLGLVDNAGGMLSGAQSVAASGTVTLGGEYAVRPFLMAAALVYGSYYTRGFKGGQDTTGQNSNYAWGRATTAPVGYDGAATAVAIDGFCFIVSKTSKIPNIGAMNNSAYAKDASAIATMMAQGYGANSIQVYALPALSDTTSYAKAVTAMATWGTDTVEVADDMEMVEKVANDQYGIGYCSTAYADPDRVTVIAPVIAGTTYLWPTASAKFRWVVPALATSTWPWKRNLTVSAVGTGGLAFQTALQTGGLKSALEAGPLFKCGYWPALP